MKRTDIVRWAFQSYPHQGMPAWGFPDTVKATDLAEMMEKERKDINQALKLLKEIGKIKSPKRGYFVADSRP